MRRRISLLESVAFAAVSMPATLAAQSTNNTATAAPTTATPAPATDGTAVGPPQLRDFNLNGTVTRPAQPVTATPAPTPRVAPPRAAPRAAPPDAPPAPAREGRAPAAREPVVVAPQEARTTIQVPLDLPPTTAESSELEAPVLPAPQTDTTSASDDVGEAEQSGLLWWPWLAALLAAVLGAGFLLRRSRQERGERYASDHDALGALVAAPAAPAEKSTPVRRDIPTAHPEPRSAPPRSDPPPSPPVLPVPPVPPVERPDGIIASRLKPELTFELQPIRAETDAAEGAALTFDLIVTNRGSAPARDVLIEAQLINANPQVDAAVGHFFTQQAGVGDRLPIIPPMSHVSIRTQLVAAAADLAPLVVEGRKLFVPVVALNAHYRWSGGELKVSSSFLVGRGDAEGGKMAPFRLDRGARSWSGLAARLHSSGLAS